MEMAVLDGEDEADIVIFGEVEMDDVVDMERLDVVIG